MLAVTRIVPFPDLSGISSLVIRARIRSPTSRAPSGPVSGSAIAMVDAYGSRYAGGLYFADPTLLHVSRGLAGIHPIRFNCPPEVPLLILRQGTE